MGTVDQRLGTAPRAARPGGDPANDEAAAVPQRPGDADPILVVDDESTIAHVVRTVLEEQGRLVLVAGSAEEGLAYFAKHTIAVALVDVVLPQMTGLQLLSEVRRIAPDTRVIVMTSQVSVESALEAIHLGAYDYLRKPFEDVESVWLTVKRALDHRALALRNAVLLEDQRRKNAQLATAVSRLATLIDAGLAMGNFRNLEDLLEFFLDLAVRELDAERASLMLVDESSRVLRIAASRGLTGLDRAGIAVPIGEGVSGRVAATGEPMLVRDIAADPALAARSNPNLADSFICAPIVLSLPIKTQEKVLGVLNVTNRAGGRVFSDGDLEYLASMNGQLAVALERTRFVEELQRTCASLKETQAELIFSEKVKAIGEIAAGVAHDYNNTLGAILARIQLALHRLERPDPDTLSAAADLKVAEKIAAQGASAIKRIQDFAGRREGMPLVSLNVNDVVRNAVELTRPKWKDECEPAGRRIEVVMDLTEVPTVRGFASDVTQVLSNLILNAIDAMPGGGTLRFRTRHEDGQVIIDVVDDGEGIPEDVQPRLFKPFFTTKSSGHGLGLSIVQNVVARHGGDVVVNSREGEGATFRIRLPAEPGRPDVLVSRPGEPAKAQRSARILLVDDLDDVRESCREMLIAGGHDVADAGGGSEAIAMMGPGRFDLVITDLGMPDVTGFEVAREAKRRSPGLPVILLSGWALDGNESRVKECAIDRVLAKPCTMSDLLGAVDETLRAAAGPAPPPQREQDDTGRTLAG